MFPFDRLRFRLTWLFALTAVTALAISWYVCRQEALELELSKLKGTWRVVWSDSDGTSSLPLNFSEPGFELLRPGVIGFTHPEGDIQYGIYEWDGDHFLKFHEAQRWCACPGDFDDLMPKIDIDAPRNADCLYNSDSRVRRLLLKQINDGVLNESPVGNSVRVLLEGRGLDELTITLTSSQCLVNRRRLPELPVTVILTMRMSQ